MKSKIFPITTPQVILSICLIVAVVLLAFWPTLSNDFVVWDDEGHLLENFSIRALDQEHIIEMFTSTVNKIYVPLTSLSFAIEYHFFGYDPFIYHLTNLILHILVTLCVFFIARRLRCSVIGASVAAILFGIHPMHVESVAWVTERKDVLYSLFYCLAILSYAKRDDNVGTARMILTTFFGLLSMLAKPMALSLPLILFLIDWYFGRKFKARMIIEKIPLMIGIVAITWITYSTHARVPGDGFSEGFLIWPWTFTFYLRQFVFPFMLVPIYRLPQPVTFANFEYAFSLGSLLLFVIAVIRLRKYRRFIFACLYFFFSIFFLLRFDSLKDTNIVADRFMYLPSLGFCVLVGIGVQRLWTWRPRVVLASIKYLALILLAGSFVALGMKTFVQNKVWRDGETLWRHQLSFYPTEHIAYNNLVAFLREREDYKQAEETYKKIQSVKAEGLPIDKTPEIEESLKKVHELIQLYSKAILVKPDYARAYYNLGQLYEDLGHKQDAALLFNKAVQVDPFYKDGFFILGNYYRDIGEVTHAIEAYTNNLNSNSDDENAYLNVIHAYFKALKINPEQYDYLEARNKAIDQYSLWLRNQSPRATSFYNLGSIYYEIGDVQRSISAYQRALDLNPKHGRSLYNLGNIQRDLGKFDVALALYERAGQSDPHNADIFVNMGIIYGQQRNFAKSIELYEKAIDADATNGKAYFNIAFTYEVQSKFQLALEWYKQAVEVDPNNAEAFYNMGNVQNLLKKPQKAMISYKKAVEIDPNHMDAWVNLSVLSFYGRDFANAIKFVDEAIILGYEPERQYMELLAPHR